jgi:hypothetical protein
VIIARLQIGYVEGLFLNIVICAALWSVIDKIGK